MRFLELASCFSVAYTTDNIHISLGHIDPEIEIPLRSCSGGAVKQVHSSVFIFQAFRFQRFHRVFHAPPRGVAESHKCPCMQLQMLVTLIAKMEARKGPARGGTVGCVTCKAVKTRKRCDLFFPLICSLCLLASPPPSSNKYEFSVGCCLIQLVKWCNHILSSPPKVVRGKSVAHRPLFAFFIGVS